MRNRAFLSLSALLLAASTASGARSWQQQWSTGDFSAVLGLAADRDRVFVAAAGGRFDVRAVAPRTGELLWHNDGAAAPPGGANAVRFADGTVWAAGSIAGVSGDADWLVRAIDPGDGSTRWQDRHDHRNLADGVNAIDAAGGKVFAAGTVNSYLRFGAEYLVRAYDAAAGTLLWEDLAATGGNDAAMHLVADVDGVWVTGVLAPSTIPDIVVRAYEPDTGEVRWSRRVDVADDFPAGITRLGPRVAVTGEAGGQWIVLVYDAATGERRWRHLDAYALQPAGVVGSRGTFIVAGAARGFAAFDMLTRCYDADSGVVLWEDRMSRAPASVHARAIHRRGDLVVIAGTIYGDPYGHAVWVRALDGRSGALRWEYGYQMPGGDAEAKTVTMLRGRLMVGGLLRPFDATSGALLLGYRTP